MYKSCSDRQAAPSRGWYGEGSCHGLPHRPPPPPPHLSTRCAQLSANPPSQTHTNTLVPPLTLTPLMPPTMLKYSLSSLLRSAAVCRSYRSINS
ncbi:hypothetical protein PBY51_019603 [Eleginops maclovinus]|uniref:Uncharacterized protein n=1 Tax=Eleginops maclovinus TaxID=56733 RepID=A0AAN8ATK7_ELEMC|nr:hypothetical protein PBY51_019603 [Eleginops maclovinus]